MQQAGIPSRCLADQAESFQHVQADAGWNGSVEIFHTQKEGYEWHLFLVKVLAPVHPCDRVHLLRSIRVLRHHET